MGTQGIVLVGVSGKARSGKDTAAEILVEHFGFTRIAFADALKEGCAAMLGLPLERMYSGDREAVLPQFGFSIRHFLQQMGTECVRNHFGQDFWIKAVKARMNQMIAEGKHHFVISDVRFDNEAMWVRRNAGHVLVIEREGAGAKDHVSEHGIWRMPEDSVLRNNGTLDEYVQAVIDWAGVNVAEVALA